MEAERRGDLGEACAAYEEAWEVAADDYERCVAAHYMPRLIDAPADKLRWNREALRYADLVGDDRVSGFYASLHANVGLCLALLGDNDSAVDGYMEAQRCLPDIKDPAYKQQVETNIAEALQRLAAP
jgi:tetratricopeptide (TPR) repeat protein